MVTSVDHHFFEQGGAALQDNGELLMKGKGLVDDLCCRLVAYGGDEEGIIEVEACEEETAPVVGYCCSRFRVRGFGVEVLD